MADRTVADRLRDAGYPRVLLAALAVVLSVALLASASTSTAAFGAFNPAWQGVSEFRETGAATGTEVTVVLNATRYDGVDANRTLAVVLSPDEPYGPAEAARLRQFLDRGGTLLVAEDFGPHSNELLAALNATVRFDGALVRDEQHNFETPAMVVTRNLSADPLLAGVERLTVNHGTVLDREPGRGSAIAHTSGFAYLDANRNGELDDNETLQSYPIVATESVGAGRVVAVADPSLFINAMQEREGNRRFARFLMAAHDRVLLDYSQTTRLPPLATLLISLRNAPGLQALVGLAGIGAVLAWGWGTVGAAVSRLRESRAGAGVGAGATGVAPGTSADAVAAFLRERHPDWDEQRVQRVVRAVEGTISTGRERDDDD